MARRISGSAYLPACVLARALWHRSLSLVFFTLSVFLFSPYVHAADITLAWNPNTEASLGGYKVYCGTASKNYPTVKDAGTQTTCTVTGLTVGTTYYFAAKAYASTGTESAYSNEVVYTAPATTPVDTDGDGLSDTDETTTYHTDPTKADTDGDGISDGTEIKNGTNPLLSDRSFASIYEDAEDRSTRGWAVYDNDPAGARISNVYDQERQSQVIQLTGSGVNNGYYLQSEDGKPWQNGSQFVAEWSMKSSEGFYVYFLVDTTAGPRYIYYTQENTNLLGKTTYAHHGLGTAAADGHWHTFVRDLEADLQEAQPGVQILEVNGFFIRGSISVDDIKLLDSVSSPPPPGPIQATVYEDAEDGLTSGWDVYDKDPAGAKISNVYDQTRQGRVVQLTGSSANNGYRLQKSDGTPWQNGNQFIAEWSMNFNESFYVYFLVDTTAGLRYLYYTPEAGSRLGTLSSIHHGLGAGAADGYWHTFVRDLKADLQAAQPSAQIIKVDAFLIRGSGNVDDIKLRNE